MENKLHSIINGLQHVGIPVSDIRVSEAFYSRFGFKNVMQSTFTIADEPGICIMMKYKEIILELYQMPASLLGEIKTRKNGHVDHVAFDVDDIDEVFALLKNESFDVIEEQPMFLVSFWGNGCKYFNILGPDQEKLEFNQIIKN